MGNRKPDYALLILADGGKTKGGVVYGSFQIGGFPGEPPLMVPRIILKESTTSSQAEGEILCEAVSTAVDGMEARSLNPKRWLIKIESDSLTLITMLQSSSDDDLKKREKVLEKELQDALDAIDGTPERLVAHNRANSRLNSARCMTRYVQKIRKLVGPFAEVRYQHVSRKVTLAAFGH